MKGDVPFRRSPRAVKRLGVLTAMLVGACLSLSALAETRLVSSRPLAWKDFLGVNAHFLWFKPAQYARQMQALKALGLEWTRVDLHWDRHEPEENRLELKSLDELVADSKQQQLKSVFYLVGSARFASSAPPWARNSDQYPPTDPAVFARRMAMLAQRYPTVDAWQVWNEPNLPSFWAPRTDARGYGRLLQASVAALRAVAPAKPVVMAGMAYYSQQVGGTLMLEELAKLGAFSLGTVIAYHPYSLAPEGDDPKARDFVLRVQEVNRRLRSVNVPAIWATEWGWSSYAGPKEEQPIIGVQGQADYLLRRLALMSALDFDRVFLFALSDLDGRASVRDQSYGLLALDGQPKPAYLALSRFLSITGPRLLPDAGPHVLKEAGEQFSVAWRRPDGTRLWLFWAGQPGTIQLSGIAQAVLHRPLQGDRQEVAATDGRLSLAADNQLQILEWK